MPKGVWKEYFTFSKKERIAVFALLTIMAAFIGTSYFYTPSFTKPVIDSTVQKQLDYLALKNHTKTTVGDTSAVDSSIVRTKPSFKTNAPQRLFYFDPNTLDAAGWKRLGFKDKTIQNILSYRQTAGGFKQPADIKKVPRIRKKSIDPILPYVRIGLSEKQLSALNNNTIPDKTPVADQTANKPKAYKAININTATIEDFKSFPGINDAVANRIIKYRTSLNGFKSVDDIAKTYGLPDTTFKKMRPYLSVSSP